jgi:hypothetical protein
VPLIAGKINEPMDKKALGACGSNGFPRSLQVAEKARDASIGCRRVSGIWTLKR